MNGLSTKELLIFFGFIGIGVIYTFIFDDAIIGMFLAALTLIPISLIYFKIKSIEKRKKLEADEKMFKAAVQKQKEKADKVNSQAKEGTWVFPSEEFYDACKKANISYLENEYSITKAKQIAEDILWQEDITLENGSNYLKIHNLKKYLAEGKILSQQTEDKRIAEQKQPRDANPIKRESVFIQRANELASLSGSKKRAKMMENLLGDYDAKIQRIKDGEEALKTLGMIYMQQQKKESSWAIMGGIADGIAGPAAGLAVAADTMANNAKIREHNAAIRKASLDMMSGIPNLVADRYGLEEEREKLRKLWISAGNKVSLAKPNRYEIWKNVHIGKVSVEKTASGVLAVSLSINFLNAFALNVPKGVRMVIDGTIRGEVWFENKLVGEVLFPLPMYGIPSNMTAEVTLDGMCGRSVAFDGEYTVKLANIQNLWIMEA